MPKASKKNYYAVAAGREGPKIYHSWDECKENVPMLYWTNSLWKESENRFIQTSRYPGAKHKAFATYQDAQNWLAFTVSLSSNRKVSSDSDSEIEIVATGTGPKPSTRQPLSKRKHKPPSSELDSDIEIIELSPPDQPMAATASISSASPEIILSPEQKKVLERVKQGQNVFFTGSAGTGKSVLLREIIRFFSENGMNVAITASTGIAAVNIGGSTVHSWAGIGLGEEEAHKYGGKFRGQKKFANVLKRWREVKALIIDEISMLDGALFDKLEFIARDTRYTTSAFGGIQLILSGDFCQLPPVPDARQKTAATFAFEAQSWSCVGPPIVLQKVFRQKDQSFINMLNEMRFGIMSDSTVKAFKNLNRLVKYNDNVLPTELFPHRSQVASANTSRLQQLSGEPRTYVAMDIGGRDANGNHVTDSQRDRLLERLVVPKQVTLKVGAQVMLLKNISRTLVNGSVGTITKFCSSREALKDGISIAQVEKGQNPFQPPPFDDPEENPTEEEGENKPPPNDRVWPVVRFSNGREMLCIPLEFTVNNSVGEMEARRDQIPLILAWALSIHKSQGQTLERVKVDLRNVFEKGQAYVALSRATNMDTLQVLNFEPSKVTAHPKVLEWYRAHISGVPKPHSDEFPSDDEVDEYEAMSVYHDANMV